jgi:hypothetical protein
MRMRHVVIYGLPSFTILFHIILSHKRHDFFFLKAIEHKMRDLIFSTNFVWDISHSTKNWARYDQNCIMVFMSTTHYSCQILMKLELFRQIFEKYSNIKLQENPRSKNRDVPCGRTYTQTDMTKLIVAFRNFSNEPKNAVLYTVYVCVHIPTYRIIKIYDKPKLLNCVMCTY